MTATRLERQLREKFLQSENLKYSDVLTLVPEDQWPAAAVPRGLCQVWRSDRFLVQVFDEQAGAVRLSICRTVLERQGRWADAIAWDELQRLKHECGLGDRWAVEIFPPDDEVVNVANMRHVFVLKEAPAFAWKREPTG